MAKKEETNIQSNILVALSKAGTLPWRNQVGVFRAYDDPSRIIKVGTAGQSDIFIAAPVTITPDMVGATVAVLVGGEVKTDTGKLRKEQKKWQTAMENTGAIYMVMRSTEQALQQIASIPAIIAARCGKAE